MKMPRGRSSGSASPGRIVCRKATRSWAEVMPSVSAGAASGAALNAAYLGYYREMARIRFALMRLAEDQGGEAVITAFAKAVQNKA